MDAVVHREGVHIGGRGGTFQPDVLLLAACIHKKGGIVKLCMFF